MLIKGPEKERFERPVAPMVTGFQLSSELLTALAGLTTEANQLILATGTDSFSMISCTLAGQALLDDATAADQRTTLGLGIADTVEFAAVKTPKIYPPADSTTALQVTKADGSTSIITVDTTNSRVGVGCTPAATFELQAASVSFKLSSSATPNDYLQIYNLGDSSSFLPFIVLKSLPSGIYSGSGNCGFQARAGLDVALANNRGALNFDARDYAGTGALANKNLVCFSSYNTAKVVITAAGNLDILAGYVNIPTAQTYNINGVPHTHAAGAPAAHNLIDTTGHPVSGLTTGHFLKASGATTYGFAAHGLTYSDVGASAVGHTHADYVVLMGVNGGQYVYGGTGAGNALMLGSTTDVAKGYVEINASEFLLKDITTAYKWAQFDCATITAGNIRTMTIPDKSGTLAFTSDLASYLPLAGGAITGQTTLAKTWSGQATMAALLKSSPADATNTAVLNAFEADCTGVANSANILYGRGGLIDVGIDYQMVMHLRAHSDTSSNGVIIKAHRGKGTEAAPTTLASGNDILRLGAYGQYDSTVGNETEAAFMLIEAAEAWSATAKGTRITLASTANGATAPTNRVYVDGSGNTQIGDPTGGNYIQFASNGFSTLLGTCKSKLSMRPQLYAGRVGGVAKPTFVVIAGAYAGYSFPIYSSDDEELFFREHVPGRWDGASDIKAYMTVAIDTANTAGEDFRMQLSWGNHVTSSGQLGSTVTDVEVQQELVADRIAQYSIYSLEFVIDWDGPIPDVSAGDHFAGRIRRIAATGAGVDEIEGEVILVDFYMTYTVDRMFKAS